MLVSLLLTIFGKVFLTSAKVTTMYQKSGVHIHTQTAFDFKLNFDIIARKDTFLKNSPCYITKVP